MNPSTALVSPNAIVEPWVVLGSPFHLRPLAELSTVEILAETAPDAPVVVHPFAVIGRVPDKSPALARQPEIVHACKIGPGTIIGVGAIIYAGVTIGRDCLIGDGASIREGSVIGDRCVIGRQVTVNYDAAIEDDVRLQDFTHITGGCRIGAGSFFGVGVVTSNDRRIDLKDYAWHGAQPPRFGRRIMVGSGANVLAGVTVGNDALIGAGALVVKDVPPGATVLGKPAEARPSRTIDEPRIAAALAHHPV